MPKKNTIIAIVLLLSILLFVLQINSFKIHSNGVNLYHITACDQCSKQSGGVNWCAKTPGRYQEWGESKWTDQNLKLNALPDACSRIDKTTQFTQQPQEDGGKVMVILPEEGQLPAYLRFVKSSIFGMTTHVVIPPKQTNPKHKCTPNKALEPKKAIAGNAIELTYDVAELNRRLIDSLQKRKRDPRFFNKSFPSIATFLTETGSSTDKVMNSPLDLAKQMQQNIQMGFPFLLLPAYGNFSDLTVLDQCMEIGVCHDDGEGGDLRAFGFERWSTEAKRLSHDAFLGSTIANLETLYGHEWRGPSKNNMVLAGVIGADPAKQPLSSGGGWHVDDGWCVNSPECECHVRLNTIKSIQLLGDNPTDNGMCEFCDAQSFFRA
jgi:hypothetical protein